MEAGCDGRRGACGAAQVERRGRMEEIRILARVSREVASLSRQRDRRAWAGPRGRRMPIVKQRRPQGT